MISGFSDIETAGNQSMKNGIKFLAEFGYQLKVFTFMPEDYPNLQDPEKVFPAGVEFHRLPRILSWVIRLGQKTKDFVGRQRDEARQSEEAQPFGNAGGYLREYNAMGRLFYLFFLFLLYIPVESFRVLAHSLRCRPDLVYGVNCQGAVVASLLGRLLRRPVIIRFHGVSVTEHDLARLRNRLLVLDEISGLTARADAVIVANDGTKGDKILRRLGVEEDKVRFWLNGFDRDDLVLPQGWHAGAFKRELGIEGKKVITMLSRLTTWKRVDRGIRCLHNLLKEPGGIDAVLIIAGEGPARQELEALAQELGVKESVRFLGGVPHKEVSKYYAIADVFLSLYDISNLGNPILEAMYFGLPIITIADGSTDYLLQDNHNALLIRTEDLPDELPVKVKQLLENGSLRRELGRNVKNTFNEKVLSWQERMKLEDRLIKGILGDGNNQSGLLSGIGSRGPGEQSGRKSPKHR
jgi:glycosyltransferase involved in cell wall biosynthesis